MKKLPLSIQTFSKLIEGNYVYIDKTEHIYRLIQGECYFFSRPRRFGKSILCSTLKSLFQGKKELFKDLWIDKNTDYSWPIYPVIHIDFNGINIKSAQEFRESLISELNSIAEQENIHSLEVTEPNHMLKTLVIRLKKKYNKRVVLIIDEYDKAILEHLTKPDSLPTMHDTIRSFYTIIKSLDEWLQFVFITGISRFSKTNIFSGFNQIFDISMEPKFAHLVGYTEAEIEKYLSEHTTAAIQEHHYELDQFKKLVKEWYNGYRFWEDPLLSQSKTEIGRLFNPYSVHHNLNKPKFKSYWFLSGTPTFLLEVIKKNNFPIESFENATIDEADLGSFNPEALSLKTLLFQTGYLTIKDYNTETNNYILTYPNQEVKEALLKEFLLYLSATPKDKINNYSQELQNALATNDIPSFIETLKQFYILIPNTIHIKQEKYFQTIFYTILKLIGLKIDVEVNTNIGRIDAVIKTEKYLYIIEFKLEKSAIQALEQIDKKQYCQRYKNDKRKIIKIGITFGEQEKNIKDFTFKEEMKEQL